MSHQRKILLTCSLPYANGDLHLGHMLEGIQADIWSRFQKMRGQQCFFICGSDCHGTPIMLQAEKQQLAPEVMVENIRQQHRQDFADFAIAFDNFYTTHSEESRQWSQKIYQKLCDKGDISQRSIEQAFDEEKQLFLSDRFVKGECPRCGASDQYGDNCEKCGATYTPAELKNPRSVLSGTTPSRKTSEHFFFELPRYEQALKNWTQSGHLQSQVSNKLNEWFEHGLQAWDISRDSPYFGFEIPNAPGKYFYVWLDAPIGYISSFEDFCRRCQGITVADYWQVDSDAELYHFIGKDVAYFHTLFWPAMLMAANLRCPTAVFVHGFLTVDGHKMSKSRGTFIKARTYLQHFKPDYLRYYFAAKLNDGVEDIDLKFEDFQQRVNSDLVGKLVNIASRCAGFIEKHFDSQLADECIQPQLWQTFVDAHTQIADYYENREYAKAMREIMRLADMANQYLAEQAPWRLIKEPQQRSTVHGICSLGINLFKVLIVYLKPVVPQLAQDSEQFLNVASLQWQDSQQLLRQHRIKPFTQLLQRIQIKEINNMMNSSETTVQAAKKESTVKASNPESKDHFKPEITIEAFAKLDLRVAKIIAADEVEGADKLLQIKLDVGGIEKQVFAGIKSSYQPQQLLGQQVVFVANLKPRKMRFGLSEGMILAAGDGKQVFVIHPDSGAESGMTVK